MSQVLKLPVIEFVELSLNFLALPFSLYFLNLLRRPFFHLNLRILLANFSIGLVMLTLTRIALVIDSNAAFLPENAIQLISVIHNACVMSIMDASALIAGERFIATWFVDKYEKIRNWWLAVGSCAMMWLINGSMSFLISKCIQTQTQQGSCFFPILGIFFAALCLNCIGVVVFVVISRYNKKCWKRDLQKNLAHRYQIMENVRTSRQLTIALLADFIISVYLFCTIFLRVQFPDALVTFAFSQIFDLLSAITGILMPILFIKTHPRLLYVAKQHFCRTKQGKLVAGRRKTNSIQPTETVAKADGNIYFGELAKSWDQAYGK